jgi:hypothetical protein
MALQKQTVQKTGGDETYNKYSILIRRSIVIIQTCYILEFFQAFMTTRYVRCYDQLY